MTYDDWKTTDSDPARDLADVYARCDEAAGAAYNDALDFASLCESLGFVGPDPYEESKRASREMFARLTGRGER